MCNSHKYFLLINIYLLVNKKLDVNKFIYKFFRSIYKQFLTVL